MTKVLTAKNWQNQDMYQANLVPDYILLILQSCLMLKNNAKLTHSGETLL